MGRIRHVYAAGRRATEVLVDRLDATSQARSGDRASHTQGAALTIVEDLMGRGLPNIWDRPALQMVRPIFSDIMTRLLSFPSEVRRRCGATMKLRALRQSK
ncbi:hypothetical protein MPL3356_10007 [Mesorhizobium plurifarium]|uniref:Uncharacterized protein n=1 Tax=Mesorhizobium plurifarium TaxID=69974 RepID=A0A090DDG2_MESPL|nr:hypothetical protein MPL3356_10007 [Mesorhizobium plurifarium]